MLPAFGLLLALAPQQPTISVTTRLVEVSVVAHDRKGNPVADLAENEFEVLENGKPQKIRIFIKSSSGGNGKATAALPPNVYSNRAGAMSQESRTPPRLTVVLFDALNTPYQYRHFAGKHLERLMKGVPPEEWVQALVLSPTGLRLLHDDKRYLLPNFREDLLLSDGGETEAEQRQSDIHTDDRIRTTLRALGIIARNLGGVSGRKNLIWITGGIPTKLNNLEPPGSTRDRRSYTVEYRDALIALNRASVAVYPIDARGLEAMPPANVFGGGQTGYRPMAPSDWAKYQEYRTGMRDIANGTGGKAYFDRNDLDRAASEAVDDARVSYTLAYYQPEEPDDKWHKITVRTKRDGVSLRHRTGYLALREDRGNDPEATLRRALFSPLDSTSIALYGRVERQPGGTAQAFLQIDPGNVGFTPEDQGYRCQLQIVTMVRDNEGRAVGKTPLDSLDLPLEGESLRKVQANGIIFTKQVGVTGNTLDVRFAVRDRITGLIGTISIPLNAAVGP